MTRALWLVAAGAFGASVAAAQGTRVRPASGQAPAAAPTAALPERTYDVIVGAEAVDKMQVVRFGPDGASLVRERVIGKNGIDPDGPHGIAVSPDARYYYVSTAHGVPNGTLWKLETESDKVVAQTDLGPFPATLQVSADGEYAWVVNFNLHGEMVPSSVSVVGTADMVELTRIPTCTMPHGSRLSPDGRHHWSVCMMDDVLVDIDATRFEVARHFALAKGKEMGMAGAPPQRGAAAGAHDHSGHGMEPPKPGDVSCSPTWAQPSSDGRTVWVACNRASELVEIDVASWTMRRRIPTGAGTYNLAATKDGRFVIGTNKRGQSVSIHDAVTGAELARVPTSRRIPSGLVVSPDDRYVFVTCEGVGSEPGAVDVIDLATRTKVASVEVGQMAGGIDIWRVR
ncbi:MAG: YncE family protein [Gemmatimonadaceae bacterium]|nr:YncE family protein [Gemmatimonadaceae bacterium]